MKNLFIALEGIDGSGKSTQVKLLSDNLKHIGHHIYTTCEPTNSPIGAMIRSIFKHQIEADHRTIAGLFVADRLDHILNKRNGILYQMEQGFTVISDRYLFSSYAYQGAHIPLEWVIAANSLSAEIIQPDLTIFIDISPEISMQRLNKGRDSLELYETLENLKNVQEKYYEAFDILKEKQKVFIVDGNRTSGFIAEDIWKEVERLINPKLPQ